MNNKKKIILGVSVVILLLSLGFAFAIWTYSKTLGDQTLISGDIFLKYTEGDTVNMKEAMPSVTYNPDEYFEFSVEGRNKYSKDVVYEILLEEGDEPTGEGNETRNVRIKPSLLKFRLVEVKEGQEEELIQEGSYDSIDGRRIWIDKVPANTTNQIKYTYRLYMWISNDAKIGNMEGADYTAEVWNNNVYASVKVGVNGDFNEKDLTEDYLILNAQNESGEPYDLKQPIQSDEDITITLGSKREVTKFVVEKSKENPIALTSLEEPANYTASYNEATRAWEAKITIDETGIYDYYAVYDEDNGINSKTYSFTVLMNPDRFVKVEKPTSELCKQGLTYTGSPQDLIDESNLDKEGYTITQVQGTDANSYEVKAKLKDKFRWSDSSQEDTTFNCTIGPKTTELTYEPATKLSVFKGSKGTIKINAPTEGTFEVTSNASETASVTFTPASGTSTTVTVQGQEEGSTSLDIKFTPSSNNYTEITDTYGIEVTEPPIATSVLKEKLGTGGLIGVTTSNTKTTSKTASNIREYRYSGAEVNNYVYFNCSDSESEQNADNCETWRIIGIFKDDAGEEHMKIVRNSTSTTMVWNSSNNQSWTSSSVNAYLNGSYLTSLTSKAQNMIYEEAKWYLGKFTDDDTTVNLYTQERSTSDYSPWTGKIGLMYPSDYGFASDSSNWSKKSCTDYSTYIKTNWLFQDANHSYAEWFLSPSSYYSNSVAYWLSDGRVTYTFSSYSLGVRAALYLKSTVQITGNNDGSLTAPYMLSVE